MQASSFQDFSFFEFRSLAYGQALYLIGDLPYLGAWNPLKALKMIWREGNNWQLTVSLPKGKVINYKYIVGPFDIISATSVIQWDEDPNQTVLISEAQEGKPPETSLALRIMSFNLRFDTETDKFNAWEYRKHLVISVIQKASPDIVATQEGFLHQIRFMKNALPNYGVYYHGRDKDFHGESCSVFYKLDRFEIEEAKTQWLSTTPEHAGTTYSSGNLIPRIFTWMRLRRIGQLTDPLKVNVINTHFCHTYQESRELSTLQIIRHIEASPEMRENLVIAGDFNAAPYEYCIKLISESGFQDTFEKNEDIKEGTFHGFTGKPEMRIDYIFAVKEAKVLSANLVRESGLNGIYPSDHFPIYTDIQFK